MGYPMNYGRVIGRNYLSGDYDPQQRTGTGLIRGDLRRMEADQRDEAHLAAYAKRAGITTEQARQVLDDFFGTQDVTWTTIPALALASETGRIQELERELAEAKLGPRVTLQEIAAALGAQSAVACSEPTAHDWQPDGGVLRFESHPGGEAAHVHTTCAKCGARAWFLEYQWELLTKGCSASALSASASREPLEGRTCPTCGSPTR